MTNEQILRTVQELRNHVRAKLRQHPDASEEQLVHNFLAALDLAPTEHRAILDEYLRQASDIRDQL